MSVHIRPRRVYHATECIFDLIAACGPQDTIECHQECRTQATVFPVGDSKAQRIVVMAALATLRNAGIIEFHTDAWDFTDYGYELVIDACRLRKEYEAHRRATLG